jgi:hypothetical protein
MNLPAIKVPGRRGLAWIGGMAALAVVGVVEAPIAIVLAAVPVIDRYVSDAGETGERARSPRQRTTAAAVDATPEPRRTRARRTATATARARKPVATRRGGTARRSVSQS